MLDEIKKRNLKAICDDIATLDNSLIDEASAYHFLDAQGNEQGEFVIRGNTEGLVHFACAILALTQNPFDGKHQHFDDNGILEENATEFIIGFKSADWDKVKNA